MAGALLGAPGSGRTGRERAGQQWFAAVLVVSLTVVFAFLVLPIAAIFTSTSPATLVHSLGDRSSLDALRLSLQCSLVAVAVIVGAGTPAAYLLATRRFRGRALLITLIEVPLVMPPAVAGLGLLATFGPRGLLGGLMRTLNAQLVFETSGVVVALAFVAAPFYLRQAQAAFEAVEPTWRDASRTLGVGPAGTFARIMVPAAARGLLTGLALSWGRALGEFGATLMFAGSFQGVTQTAPLAIYQRFAVDFNGALALSAVLVAVAAALLLTVRLLDRWASANAAH